jgi:hypothetical protein
VHLQVHRSIACFIALTITTCAGSPAARDTREDDLEVQATRRLLAWLTSRAPLAGFDAAPGTAWVLEQAERIPVVGDGLDVAVALSTDPRVPRVTLAQRDELWQRHGYDRTVYVSIRRIPRYAWSRSPLPDHIALELRYAFGNAGAHRYEFAFWREGEDLRAAGFLVGSS